MASTLLYDIQGDPDAQLAALPAEPTQLYYFATPTIAGRKAATFRPERFAQFLAFYVTGFASLMDALLARRAKGLAVLYPSTVFIDDRPEGMTEYAMAKAAGEILCVDLAKDRPTLRILVPRLPRLPTDQTASLQAVDTADPVAALLPQILALQATGG
jgi:nucleoside-diphosphate-sugar epimerase